MESQQVVVDEAGVCTPEVRHCSVCFAVIDDVDSARRSLEGHLYCERCSAGFFREVRLRGLRETSCLLPVCNVPKE